MVRIEHISTFFSTWFGHLNPRYGQVNSIRCTYRSWRRRFPRWVNTGFDEYFLLHDALPLLSAMLAGEQAPDPAQLAHKWVTAFGIPPERTAYAITELAPVAADFLARLQVDYDAQSYGRSWTPLHDD
jgi:hypothetical protein